MTDPVESELIDRAVAGDSAAMRALLEQHGPQVYRRIQGKIGGKWRAALDADDVMQVSYLQACLHIDQFAGRNATSFIAWLTRIAENNLRDAINELQRPKRPQPDQRVQTPPSEDSYVALLDLLGSASRTPSRDAASRETVAVMDDALKKLPGDYERAVRLYDLEGRSVADVAASMGRSVGAVHMLRARAHERLRDLLGSAAKFFSDSP